MKSFAVIENNIVINTIFADSKNTAQAASGKTCVEFTKNNPACIGLGYDGTTFEQPPAPVEEETPTE